MSAESLVRAANRRGINQQAVARITSTSQPTISRVLSGMGSSNDKSASERIRYRLMQHLQVVDFRGEHYILRGQV